MVFIQIELPEVSGHLEDSSFVWLAGLDQAAMPGVVEFLNRLATFFEAGLCAANTTAFLAT